VNTASASLPHHQYVWVDKAFVRKGEVGFEPAVWFGLHSHPGRAWGCTVMLECGAVYRNLPPHAIAFCESPQEPWSIQQAQRWDCYGWQFSVLRYTYLVGLQARTKAGLVCDYLFTAVPVEDAFSEDPAQNKEFMFMRTCEGRLLILPTNDLLFVESSFTVDAGWPKLSVSDVVWTSEGLLASEG
jgi:hypothetical protein